MSNRVANLAIRVKSILVASAAFVVLALLVLPVGCDLPFGWPPLTPSPSPTPGGGASTPTPGTGVFTPNVIPGAPAQVTGLQGSTQPDAGATRLAWSPNRPNDAVLGYRVYRSPVGMASFQLLADVPADVTTYTDDAASCGQMYFVTAYNAEGESLPSTSSYFSRPCR